MLKQDNVDYSTKIKMNPNLDTWAFSLMVTKGAVSVGWEGVGKLRGVVRVSVLLIIETADT